MKLQRTTLQTQKILPAQIQFLNFLKLQKEELLQTINLHLEENPFLEDNLAEEAAEETEEIDISYEDAETYEDGFSIREVGVNDRNVYEEKRDIFSNTYRGNTTREDLIEEIRSQHLSKAQFDIACYLVNSLDEDGYLRQELEDVIDHFSFARQQIVSNADVETALEALQSCEPAGVGARDLRECLMLQLFRKEKKSRKDVLSYEILEDHFHLLTEHKMDELCEKCGTTSEMLQQAFRAIKALKARPAQLDEPNGRMQQQQSDIDFIITRDNAGNLVGMLASSFAGRIRMSADSEHMLNAAGNKEKKNLEHRQHETFLKAKAKEARWFIDCILQREDSMKKVIDTIIELQGDYLISGDKSDLKPMILQHIAERVNLDVSTVSRITSTRCADTPIGKIHLKDLFTTGVQSEDGGTISNANVKEIIAELIAQEDKRHPYTDEELARLLASKGIKIARRTVLKYREQMKIPVGKLRCLQAA